MARQHSIERVRRTRKARARRRSCIAALGTAAGALLAAAISPATAPPASADVVDAVADPIINSLQEALTGLTDAFAGFSPTDVLDSLAALEPAAGISGSGLGSLALDTSSLSAAASALAGGTVSAAAADSALTSAADSSSAASSLDALLQTLEQEWITSSVGAEVDTSINSLWQEVGGSGILIGNGADGVGGATLAEATGGAGGLLFGDGGNGVTDAAGQGGAGGAAGLFGDGGDGGAGADGTGAGVAGGDGGDGGTGGTLMGDGGLGGDGGTGGAGAAGGSGGDGGNAVAWLGNGGNGGAGGDGSNADGLAALGGAGGNGGIFGSHGDVGDYGALSGAGSQTQDLDGTVLPIGTTGSWLTNSDGQVVILHGLNEVYKVAPYEPSASGFSNDDAAFLAANGFNAVRVGVIWSELEPEPGVFNTAYLDSIEQTVQTLGNNGIYSILDFHQDLYSSTLGGEGAPDWAVETNGAPNIEAGFPGSYFVDPAESQAWDSFWSNADAPNGIGLENSYAQMLEYVANAFNGNPDVAGMEIMNEPDPGSQTLSTVLGSPFFDAQELTPFYNQAADAIRAVDPTTPIFYEPNPFFEFGLPTHLGTVDATGTVFSFHDYCDADLGSLGCFPSVTGVADNAATYAEAQGIPAFMTEFGAGNDQSLIGASMQTANQHLTGWTEWTFSGQGDVTADSSSQNAESLVYNPELPPVGSNVNTANLETLAEPYPQEVSGTPDTWSFENGTFQFSYSTEEVDGLGNFPDGSQTTISVPAVEFPSGYEVTITGGQVVSAPDASELIIASNAGANTVTVTVSPAAGS